MLEASIMIVKPNRKPIENGDVEDGLSVCA